MKINNFLKMSVNEDLYNNHLRTPKLKNNQVRICKNVCKKSASCLFGSSFV